jgi:glycosyltransferase involved in cell wall biosynthesis
VSVCAIVSFRLGLSDGVSIVASQWQQALGGLGWKTVTVAGDGPVDRLVPGLAIDADEGPPRPDVERALADADLVVVENLLSIPLNLAASRTVAEVLAGRPALLHHHDPPWQRERFAHVTELPPDDPQWRHVTINRFTEQQFAERGLQATTIYNGFDADPAPGDRAGTRAWLGIDDDVTLAAHPVRAIARKNIPAAVELCRRLDAVYWLPNPAEEGYDDELVAILERAGCPVIRHSITETGRPIADLYAAADLVLFPSTWEGFGNPPVEASLHRKPVVVGDYPVSRELRDLGFEWYAVDDVAAIADALKSQPTELLEANRRTARTHLSLDAMTDRLQALCSQAGWLPDAGSEVRQ